MQSEFRQRDLCFLPKADGVHFPCARSQCLIQTRISNNMNNKIGEVIMGGKRL